MVNISNYRADIDGLRALAVLSVIVFHAGAGWLPGGFLGVDVFFVISGFLITGILLQREAPIGRVLKDFYARRIRRLVPPAVPVIAATLIGGYMLLPPAETVELFRSALAYALFVSNWFFMGVSGYFDISAEYKPLLHTWSLSVEEQFYLLFPIFVLLLSRRASGRTWVAGLMTLVIIASFAYNLVLIGSGELTRLFFSSLSRFWEIAVGGLLATGLVPAIRRSGTAHVVSGLGLGAIVFGFVMARSGQPVPGWVAAPAVIGTALVIHARSGWANSLLSLRPIVGIGLISYALYLWHWPIFVALRYIVGEPDPIHYLLATGLTFALSIFSFFVFEKPFRFGRLRPSDGLAFGGLAAVTSAFALTAYASERSDGFTERYPGYQDAEARVIENFSAWKQSVRHDVCLIPREWSFEEMKSQCLVVDSDRNNILLVGDSHASQLLPGLEARYADANISLLSVSSCSMGTDNTASRDACTDLVEWLYENPLEGFDGVIVTSRSASGKRIEDYKDLLDMLSAKVPVIAFGPTHHYVPNQTNLFLSSAGQKNASEMDALFDEAVAVSRFDMNRDLKTALGDLDITYVDLLAPLCGNDPTQCRHLDDEGLPILVDNTHMSPHEVVRLFGEIESELETIADSRRDRTSGDAVWAPRGLDLDTENTIWSSTSPRGIVAGTGATVSYDDRGLEFDLEEDGRLVFTQDIDPSVPGNAVLSFRATAILDEPIDVPVNLIIQNRCEHTVDDGRSFDVLLDAPELVIDKRQPLETEISCIQVRLWSRQSAVSGRLEDIQIVLIQADE